MSSQLLPAIKKEMAARVRQAKAIVPDPEELSRINTGFYTAIEQDSKLQACSVRSVLRCIMDSYHIGLVPGPGGEAYLVPRKRKGEWEMHYWPGYKGLVRLARQADDVSDVACEAVRQKDHIEIDFGTHPKIVHRPALEAAGDIVGFYCIIRKTGDRPDVVAYMTVPEIEKHAETFADSYGTDYSPWGKKTSLAWEKMCKKTVFRKAAQFLSYRPLQRAVEYDEVQEIKGEPPTLDVEVEVREHRASAGKLDEVASSKPPAEKPKPKRKPVQRKKPEPPAEAAEKPKMRNLGGKAHILAGKLLGELNTDENRVQLIRAFCTEAGFGERTFSDLDDAEKDRVIAYLEGPDADAIASEWAEQQGEGESVEEGSLL